jgi:hypothetical protein
MGAIDILNFYIHNDLKEYQHMRFHISMIPQEIINEYNLQDIVDSDGWCYAEIRKAMYGLKESGFIANQELKIVLAKAGYVPTKFTPGFCTFHTRRVKQMSIFLRLHKNTMLLILLLIWLVWVATHFPQ